MSDLLQKSLTVRVVLFGALPTPHAPDLTFLGFQRAPKEYTSLNPHLEICSRSGDLVKNLLYFCL